MDPPRTRSDWLALRQYCLAEALRVLGNREDAEEAAQEAMLRAWRHRRSRRSAAWLPWVRTIARNEALRVAARRSQCAQREVHRPLEPEEGEAASELYDVVDAVSMGELLSPLRKEERDLLRLRYEKDLTNPKLQGDLECPRGRLRYGFTGYAAG